jgi:hypothetical protein
MRGQRTNLVSAYPGSTASSDASDLSDSSFQDEPTPDRGHFRRVREEHSSGVSQGRAVLVVLGLKIWGSATPGRLVRLPATFGVMLLTGTISKCRKTRIIAVPLCPPDCPSRQRRLVRAWRGDGKE